MTGPSGCDRLLERLADGAWHSSYELTVELGVMVHSRAAELRATRGARIESRRVPGVEGLRAFEYRLLAPLDEPDPQPSRTTTLGTDGGSGSSSGGAGVVEQGPRSAGAESAAAQLSLLEAAA